MAKLKVKSPYDKEGTFLKKNQPAQPEINLGNKGCVNLNIYLTNKKDLKNATEGKFGGFGNNKDGAMDGDKADSDAVLTINIYL